MVTRAVRVAIIGAGPAGCILARLLLRSPNANRISVTVFEAEASLDFRSQGGTLDLHADSGLMAIREAGLYDEFRKHGRYDGVGMRACDKRLVTWLKMPGGEPGKESSSDRPEIDRKDLRKLLANSVPEEVIRWGWKLKKVEDDLVMHFENGMTERGYDLIVGADGAWSKARAALSDQMPIYSGVGGHEFLIHDAPNAFPEVDKLVNNGNIFTFSDGKTLGAQQLGDGNIIVHVWSVRSEDWMKNSSFDIRDASQTKAALLEEFHDWHPQLLSLIQSSGDEVWSRSLYKLPTGFRWSHRNGITLIGDAAHLMPPFGGDGVNLAFVDALDLSRAISASLDNSEDTMDSHIAKFEDTMLKRSSTAQSGTEANMEFTFFSPGAPRSIVEKMVCRAVKDQLHPILYPFVVVIVYSVFFCYKCYVDLFL